MGNTRVKKFFFGLSVGNIFFFTNEWVIFFVLQNPPPPPPTKIDWSVPKEIKSLSKQDPGWRKGWGVG